MFVVLYQPIPKTASIANDQVRFRDRIQTAYHSKSHASAHNPPPDRPHPGLAFHQQLSGSPSTDFIRAVHANGTHAVGPAKARRAFCCVSRKPAVAIIGKLNEYKSGSPQTSLCSTSARIANCRPCLAGSCCVTSPAESTPPLRPMSL